MRLAKLRFSPYNRSMLVRENHALLRPRVRRYGDRKMRKLILALFVLATPIHASESVRELISKLDNKDAPWHQRCLAAVTLGDMTPVSQEAVAALARNLDARNSVVALGHIGTPAITAMPILDKAFPDHSNYSECPSWAYALSRIDTAAAISDGLLLLHSSDRAKRNCGAMIFMHVRESGGEPAVLALMQSLDSPTATNAIPALGLMGSTAVDALPALSKFLDGSPSDRRFAAYSLGAICDKSHAPACTNGEIAKKLRARLSDNDWQVRNWAAVGLAKLAPSEEILDSLEAAMQDNSASLGIEAAVLFVSIQHDDSRAISALFRAIDKSVAFGAFAGLHGFVAMGTRARPAIPELRKRLFETNDENMKHWYASTLSALGDTLPPEYAKLNAPGLFVNFSTLLDNAGGHYQYEPCSTED